MISTCWVSWVFFLLPSWTFSFLQESIHFTIFQVHYLCSISLLQPSLPPAGQTMGGQASVPGAAGGATGLQSRKEAQVRPSSLSRCMPLFPLSESLWTGLPTTPPTRLCSRDLHISPLT